MARTSDIDRVLSQLLKHGGAAPNARIRDALNLSGEKYDELRSQLISEKKIRKLRGRGGGIELTEKGERDADNAVSATRLSEVAKVKESDLYAPFCDTLRREIADDEEAALVVNTARMRLRGQWRNPDIVKLAVRKYTLFRTSEVIMTTYELKTLDGWDLNSAYEAAAHRRFAHYANLVIPSETDSDDSALEDLTSVCGRLGVGLILIRKHYNAFRQNVIIEPGKSAADLADVEQFASHLFERDADASSQFEKLWINSQS